MKLYKWLDFLFCYGTTGVLSSQFFISLSATIFGTVLVVLQICSILKNIYEMYSFVSTMSSLLALMHS